jgi:NNP family nitrate/nitrite transporter-like MFS transporter
VLARPVGGVLADKVGPKPVVISSLAGVAVLAWVVNLQPDGEVPAGLTFVAMAAALGLGAGGVFAWVGVLAPAGKVGSISGVVSAAGGLGGYFPPLVMGATYDAATHSYSIGLLLLVVTALVALAFTIFAVKGRSRAKVAAAQP